MTEHPRRAGASRLLFVCVLAAGLAVAACGGVPAEATAQHGKAVAALASKDKASFKQLVVPSQRAGALGLKDGLGIKSTKKVSTFTLDDVLDIQFFREAKSVQVNTDLSQKEGDTIVRLGAVFDFGGSSAVRYLVLAKSGDQWLVDMKATLEWWEKLNGADAFSAVGLK